jgi:DNA (cytosine-5)-methyltransferase 1
VTFGSLFSGIGGIDLGLERAGMTVKWQVEIDDYCNRVLTKHWPDTQRYEDVRDVGRHNLAPVDLVTGGFPCQPFSVAGKRAGTTDNRHLWPEMLRIVTELRPTWVLGENVAGFISMGLNDCLADLEGIGYETRAFVIPACAVGAPHRRDRVWILAHHWGERREGIKSQEIQGECRLQGSQDERGAEAFLLRSDLPSPLFCGSSDGVPNWVDRLRALGNAVVPQVVEVIGRAIMEVEL